VGKHTDALIAELVNSTTDKTDCLNWNTHGWGGYQRVLGEEINHQIGKKNTQRLERTNGMIRQQTGQWHRRPGGVTNIARNLA
jgi:IS1 family transposase